MWRKYRESIINLIYPARCLACKKIISPREIVCEGCLAQIERNHPPFCPRCGRNIKGAACQSCRGARLYFDRAFSPCRYRATVSRLIVLFKYKGKTRLLDIFSRIICDFIRRFRIPVEDMDMAAPIPLHPVRSREREFNQSQLLCRTICQGFKISERNDNLIRIHNRKMQAGIGNHRLRFENVKDAFILKDKRGVKNKNILLVDDVLTSGATCSEAARTLKMAGAKSVSVLTLASTG